MERSIEEIVRLTGGTLIGSGNSKISEIIVDSRSQYNPENSLFFALRGPHHDGHDFINQLYKRGLKNFIVEQLPNVRMKNANFIKVNDSLKALQDLGREVRSQYKGSLIGVTGSNGKTIIKEWAAQILSLKNSVIRSPKSYNSQLGVALSLLLLDSEFDYALIEAGISHPGEMRRLEHMIQPDIGIITNIGEPHQENFDSKEQKLTEKLELFKKASILIYSKDHSLISRHIQEEFGNKATKCFCWSVKQEADLQITSIQKDERSTTFSAIFKKHKLRASIPFTDKASVENALHVWLLLLVLGIEKNQCVQGLETLNPVAMRLELKQGKNQCTLINDVYNSDIASLEIALDFMNQLPAKESRTLIMSDILQSGRSEEDLYTRISNLVNNYGINRFIGIGETLVRHADKFKISKNFFNSTEDYLKFLNKGHFKDEIILLKGARKFEFEKISNYLEHLVHESILEINLNKLVHNLNCYRRLIEPSTRLMVMVKAFSYGSGSVEIAHTLQYHGVDMLAVAYADEGVILREEGIGLPIMVMSPDSSNLNHIISYNLEPEIYSLRILNELLNHIRKQNITKYPVHIKIDTGMNRLGFIPSELDLLFDLLRASPELEVRSVFSHLSSSEDPAAEDFTNLQISEFKRVKDLFAKAFPEIKPLFHILNSAGIERFPEAQFDMVRLGIGLHGFGYNEDLPLQIVSSFTSTIIQIKESNPGSKIGYGPTSGISEKKKIAVIPVGYADGLPRSLGNGAGFVFVRDKRVPIIGNICMDMCMLDITGTDCKVGDIVEVFGTHITVAELAKTIGTIPYEILTGISQRVKRIYIQE